MSFKDISNARKIYGPVQAGRDTSTPLKWDTVQGRWVPATGGETVARKWDTVLGMWVPIEDTNKDTNNEESGGNSPPTPSSDVDSKGKADKEYIDIEFNTLEGDLNLTSSEKSIRLKVGDTIRLEGIGKYLSGLYFVSAIHRTLDKDGGYTHTLSVIKTGFGDSLKKKPPQSRKPQVEKTAGEFKVGDKVKIVGNAVYSNAHNGVKVPEWVKKQTLTVEAVSKDGSRVRLSPIFSWTYTKYLQKV